MFIDTIRALALVKRFGDRLTLIGYGQHRRSLAKWAVALQVHHLVDFGSPHSADLPCGDGHGVVIRFDRDPAAVTLSVPDGATARIERGDLIALASALMAPSALPRLPVSASLDRARPAAAAPSWARGFATMRRRLPL